MSKCIEGVVLAYFNQGEVCTCPSRLLVHEDIYEQFMAKIIERTKLIKRGHPLDTETMVGAQASKEQFDKILKYIEIGKEEGAELLIGGEIEEVHTDHENGFYIQPTLFKGTNKMRIFQEEIFGPVIVVTTFKSKRSVKR
jgi:aldehyde dehydrogenase